MLSFYTFFQQYSSLENVYFMILFKASLIPFWNKVWLWIHEKMLAQVIHIGQFYDLVQTLRFLHIHVTLSFFPEFSPESCVLWCYFHRHTEKIHESNKPCHVIYCFSAAIIVFVWVLTNSSEDSSRLLSLARSFNKDIPTCFNEFECS